MLTNLQTAKAASWRVSLWDPRGIRRSSARDPVPKLGIRLFPITSFAGGRPAELQGLIILQRTLWVGSGTGDEGGGSLECTSARALEVHWRGALTSHGMLNAKYKNLSIMSVVADNTLS